MLLAAPAAAVADSRPLDGMTLAQVRIQQHIIIRVPRAMSPVGNPRPLPPSPPINWTEKRADNCVKLERLAGAAVTRADSVDLLMINGRRMRAKLDAECPALDFYSGLYVKPTRDGMLCASRDIIRSRAGSECRIRAFRSLEPEH